MMTREDIAKLSDEEANVMIAEALGYELLEVSYSSHQPVTGFKKGKHGVWQTSSSVKWSTEIEEQEIKCVGRYFVHLNTGQIYADFDGPDNGINGQGNFSYCSDLNAMHEALATIPHGDQEREYVKHLYQIVFKMPVSVVDCVEHIPLNDLFRLFETATARQRAEALLATIQT